ncbi:alpha/beta hydrolase family protein [Paludisphaera mucosa]|uniref:Alpha/beta hydrolase n=1 Tax=Paludisphaera mucosa TaxID=3030827 RepID=A0ABT6FBP0_9BACT|nr:hypothetical protein [Paludisphaera mucosa]MDG3004795.1 hypothetical protein [Paludisphaera mucosa]
MFVRTRVALSIVIVLLAADAARLKAAEAPPDGYTPVAGGVRYREIGTYDVARLDRILTTERREFSKFEAEFPPARYPVRLYRVLYESVIPERGNRPTTASGLVAVPDAGRETMPVVSYQHGTVFTKTAVPSHPDESMETRLMLAQFAGQGYVVIGADYFGKGESAEPDGYLVKASTQQACLDMLRASRPVCDALKVRQGPLFVSGWSQGAWSTMAFLEKLESVGVPVAAAAVASTPNDLFAIVNRWIHAPRDLDAVYLPALLALQLNAYAEYHDLPGLAASAIEPAYQQAASDLYDGRITWEEFRSKTPASLNEFLREEFRSASSVGEGRFWRILRESQVYHWRSRTPLRSYYGEVDEVVPPFIATLPIGFQDLMGGAETRAMPAGSLADHRGTFVHAVLDQKAWFDASLAAGEKHAATAPGE